MSKKMSIVFGVILSLTLVSMIYVFVSSNISWSDIKDNYKLQYAHGENDGIYYKENENLINVKKVYDIENKELELDLNKYQIATLYCKNDKKEECILFDKDNIQCMGIEHPILMISLILFVLSMVLFLFIPNTPQNQFKRVFVLGITFAFVGISLIINQLMVLNNYNNLKSENAVSEVSITGYIYGLDSTNNKRIKPYGTYLVDGKEYSYVHNYFVNDKIENAIDKTINIYYNPNNPKEFIQKKNPFSFGMFIFGLLLLLLSIPILFHKQFIKKRLQHGKK